MPDWAALTSGCVQGTDSIIKRDVDMLLLLKQLMSKITIDSDQFAACLCLSFWMFTGIL